MIDPDTPIPSIERSETLTKELLRATNQEYRPRTPSISLTPSPSNEPTPTSAWTPSRSGSCTTNTTQLQGIDERIANLHFADTATNGYKREPGNTNEQTHNSSGKFSGVSADGNDLADGIASMGLSPGNLSQETSSNAEYLRPTSAGSDLSINSDISSRQSTPGRRSSSAADLAPHRIEDEEPPLNKFHEPRLQDALGQTRKIVADLLSVLECSSLPNEPDSLMRKLHQQAQSLRDFTSPADRVVGLVGDSGVGKSSLINSLLDRENFARTSNSGAACTCVVTEYHYHDEDHFVLETDYFTLAEIESQFTELLRNYREYHLHKNKEKKDTEETSETKDLEEKAKIARDTFHAAFRGTNNLEEQHLLVSLEETAEDTMLNAIRSLYLATVPSQDLSQETFDDITLCSSRLMQLTSETNDSNEPAQWPLIRKIRVKLRAHILSKGLIVADLPGLRDLNTARVKITERYLLKCHQIFTICNIGRATTDKGVEEVFELAKRAKLSNVGIVCTRSDDIRAEEAEHDWKGEYASRIADMRSDVKKINEKLAELERNIRELEWDSDSGSGTDGEDERLPELRRNKDKLNKRKEKAMFRLNEFLIKIRNEKVTKELRKVFQKGLTSQLHVFCISNYLYWDHRREGRKQSLPFLNLSGILGLRKHCLSIVADSQCHAAKHYMHDAVPALAGSLQLWVDSGAGTADAEAKQLLRSTIEEIKQQITAFSESNLVHDEYAHLLKQLFEQQISDVMRSLTKQWVKSARHAALQWTGWHHASYAAFCRNYGDYTTAAVGRRCWNNEAIEDMASNMQHHWDQFLMLTSTENDDSLVAKQKSAFEKAKASALTVASTNDSMNTLARVLNHRNHLLADAIQRLLEDFDEDLFRLKTDALTGIRTSFVGRLLEDTYIACIQDSGTGVDRRRKTRIESRFGDERLFREIRALFRGQFAALADDLQTKLQQTVNQHAEVIMRDLRVLMDENAATECEENPVLRRNLEAELGQARMAIQVVHDSIAEY